ncbi:interleukin-18 receptor accessory protein isoform X2 [Lates calcarifer]|uniref:Interleukin-18 receptor accessory protein isoform X2 n=1 Tax=Lates calcarifer TaxID=8187 RepID=A0AAJ7PUW5_LATCA|nr:interleukin-18 receptor accessory protein isoform X2 [Lates calcarifer]
MQTGHVLFFFIFPVVLEGCCVGNHQKKRTGLMGLQQNTTHQRYRAVEGESFIMPCVKSESVVWSRIREDGGNEGPSYDCEKEFPAEVKHSGNYTCHTGGSKYFLHLQVEEKSSPSCFQPEESTVELYNSAGGEIPCPRYDCSNNTDVTWYKGNRAVSEMKRAPCEKDGLLHLCQVKAESDPGVYFCDRQIIEQGVMWTFRRAVKVEVIPYSEPSGPLRFMSPADNATEEVELGQTHNLTCKVFFPYEKRISAKVQWFMNYNGNKENMTLLPMEPPQYGFKIREEYGVTRRAIIKEVTQQHLKHTYTCIASNTVRNNSVTIKLKKKTTVKLPCLVGYPLVSFLLVSGLGIILHVKWMELQLIYRSHFQHGKHDEDNKEFDVFLSYVWSPPSAEGERGWTFSSGSGPNTDEEGCPPSMDPLNSEEGKATQKPLQVLLPQVLEEQWGYRLCLLERDVLPGGAYTNDVVLTIQRSKMLICLLSADYLCNSDAVFVLESGVQALLQNSAIKLLLIWTSRDSASLIQQDPPLPTLVQRALKVLPSLNWTSGKPARATCNFWRSLRKAMPHHRVKLVSDMQDQSLNGYI